jgi:acetyl esterase/lipase
VGHLGTTDGRQVSGLTNMEQSFHPELRRIARFLPRNAFTRRTLPLMQWLSRRMARKRRPGVTLVTLPGDISARMQQPSRPRNCGGAMLWIHGGGYVIGSATQDDQLCRQFAERLGIPVIAVEYRLAPQYPYPAALEDCYAAMKWLSQLDGIDPNRIVIGGASAGGGLAAALALLARDRGEITPLFQLLVYPMLDDRSSNRADIAHPLHRMWTDQTNRLAWDAYLRGADREHAVPGRQEDLSRLAPAWIGVGTLDPLHEENVDYARRLRENGVPCALDVVPGAFHGFDVVASRTNVSRSFFDRQCNAIETALDGADITGASPCVTHGAPP